MKAGTLLLTRCDVAALLTVEECTEAVERAFKMYGEGKTQRPGVLGVHAQDGGFHIKAGVLQLDRSYFAAKINANFPENPKRLGLPTIQGVIVLSDAANGYPLAVMDSTEITSQRTAAATAVAAKYLARPGSKTLSICGCGNQGRVSLRALKSFFPLEQVFAYDVDSTQSEKFANDLSAELGMSIKAVTQLDDAVPQSDICVTCTPSRQFFLKPEHIAPGTFIAAVGADNEDKQELDPTLLRQSKVVADILEQCATIGELHHALDQKLMMKEQVHAELGEVVAATKAGRTSSDEIIIFDSTGMALQDVVSAAFVYEKAKNTGAGTTIELID
ncbi:MAG TPA: ornithine cyclodeaminase family protein [Pyrinomonadaceae bacterium]|nr:ornithine cyclodeaminase family protein [Pyrinomonadaceae bacterium]